LLWLAAIITPNVDEAEALTGLRVRDANEMKAAAMRLHELGARGVVVTGGHLAQAVDVMSLELESGRAQEVLAGERIESGSTHGTGCAFAMAVACNLALGREIRDAVVQAKLFVREAISSACAIGQGTGPVNLIVGKWKTES